MLRKVEKRSGSTSKIGSTPKCNRFKGHPLPVPTKSVQRPSPRWWTYLTYRQQSTHRDNYTCCSSVQYTVHRYVITYCG